MRDYFPIDDITVIRISGKDRLKWLNNLVTNDLKPTSGNRSVECFVTDVKGRTLAHGIVFADQDSLVFFSWGKDQAAKLLSHWDRYIIREDVTLVDESLIWRWAFVRRTWLTSHFANNRFESMVANEVVSPADSSSAIAIACSAIGEDYILVRFAQDDPIERNLPDRATDLQTEDTADLEARRICSRWPKVGVDFDEKNLPQELDRNANAISFNKGCYLGQETVARLDALGQVQKKLVMLSIDNSDLSNSEGLKVGAVVTKEQQEAGAITSLATTDVVTSTFVALAYVRRAFFAAGTELTCNGYRAIVHAP